MTLQKWQLRKYLLYVIGEIILVVIGILIALRINNANEQAKNEARIQNILVQVQTELQTNIEVSIEIMESLMEKDALIQRVMSGRHQREDYLDNDNNIRNLVTDYEIFNIQEEAFRNLLAESKQLSSKYNAVMLNLRDLYIPKKNWIENADAEVQRIVLRYWDWEINNTDWFSEKYFRRDEIPAERIDFYLNSPYYKNIVYDYFNSVLENQYPRIQAFCLQAAHCHQQIAQLLQPVPDGLFTGNAYTYPPAFFDDLVGTYTGDLGPCKIYSDGGQLIMDLAGEKSLLIPIANDRFIGYRGMFCHWQGAGASSPGFVGRYGKDEWSFQKVGAE
ncbi:MAG: hypothetical protein AAF146_14835 [Bacteroidota bacterium]